MAKAILDARIYLKEVDLSGYTNACAINCKTDVLDCTTFSDTYKDKLAGMTDVIFDASGYFSADSVTGDPDHKLFDQLALNDAVVSICPEEGATGTTAFFFRPTLTQYNPVEGKVGEMATFKLHGEGAAPLVKGTVMMPKAAKTLTGTSTPYQLGVVSATQTIYVGVHVFTVSGAGPTLDLVLQSDTLVGFGSPTAQITIPQITTVGQVWTSKAGAIAEDWWRISYTIGGAGPSFTLAVVAGIV